MEDFEGACSSAENAHIKQQDAISKGQLEALQEEVLHLRAQIALLQAEIATKDKDSAVVEDQPNVIYFACDMEANENGNQLNDLNGASNQLLAKP